MDGDVFRTRIEREHAQRLDALDSPDLLVALADGEPDATSVLEAAANSEHAARLTFERWVDTEREEGVCRAFADSADQERRHYERVVDELPPGYDPADGGPLHAYLRGREDTIQRVAAGLVARSLVSLRSHTQLIEYFEGERAELFRELRADTEGTLGTGLALLEGHCSDDDWEHAEMAAGYVIRVAHDDYTDSLAELDGGRHGP